MYNRDKFHPVTPNIMALVCAQTNRQTNRHTNEVLYSIDIIVYNGITYHLVLVKTLFCIKTGFYRDKMGIFLGFVPLEKLILTQI